MEHAIVRRLVRTETAEIEGGRALDTWNDLLGAFPGTIGVKTGHTDRADWCQVAAVRRHGATVYAVVLGSPSRRRRNADLRDLLTWGLDQYGRVGVVSTDHPYAQADVPFSDERVELVAGREAAVTVPLWKPVVERVVAPSVVPAPLGRGERVGDVEVLVDGRVVARRPLVAAAAVPEPGWDERLGWYADRTLDEAGSVLDDLLAAVT
jgi:D-alanyl-D-alanine carboxypeptidase (penicillin-binding protein 5/6)